MKKKKREDELTPEEKEILRKLMETPNIEQEWEFFSDMSDNIPPPEFFMRGKPEPRFPFAVKLVKVCAVVVCVLTCAAVLAPFMTPMEATADKTPFQLLSWSLQNGFFETKPESEGDDVTELETIIEDEEDAKTIGRRLVPGLLFPSYIPEAYHFKVLKIVQTEEFMDVASLTFDSEDGNVIKIEQFANQDDAGTIFKNNTQSAGTSIERKLSYQIDEFTGSNMLTMWQNEKICLTIWAKLSDDEIAHIYEGLE